MLNYQTLTANNLKATTTAVPWMHGLPRLFVFGCIDTKVYQYLRPSHQSP